MTGQEGAVDHGSLGGETGSVLCDTAFCTADVFHGMNCSSDRKECVYLEHSPC